MRPISSLLPVLAAQCALAYSYPKLNLHSAGISEFSTRQANPIDCNATCSAFNALSECTAPYCGCTLPYLQAQGACFLCQASKPADAAAVQFLLDAEVEQCRIDGIHVTIELQLSPAAAAIVRNLNTHSEELRRDQTAFLALQVAGGHVGLVVFLLHSVFSRRVNRDPTLFNFCLTWILSSIAFSLLLYRGTDGNTVANSLGFVRPDQCLAQAALTSGAQVMTACSTMALVIQLWLCLQKSIHGNLGPKHIRLVSISLLVFPYILFLAFGLLAIFLGRKKFIVEGAGFETAVPTNFYCLIMDKNGFLPVLYGVTLALLALTVVFDVLILRILYRHWRAFRSAKVESSLSLSTLMRVMAFSIYRIGVAVAYGAVLRVPPKSKSLGEDVGFNNTLIILFGVPRWVDMLQAAIPLVAFLVLGTSRDTVAALVFWRKPQGPLPVSAPVVKV